MAKVDLVAFGNRLENNVRFESYKPFPWHKLTSHEALAIVELIRASHAFLRRVDELSPKIDSVTLVADMHQMNPFGPDDNWTAEHDALADLYDLLRHPERKDG